MDNSDRNRGSSDRSRLMSAGLAFPLVLLLVLFVSGPGNADETDAEIDQAVKTAVLAADWPRVSQLLDHVNTETPSPVLRMIKAHASLAQNRNNESLTLFVQLSVEDLQAWQSWSTDFAAQNSTKDMPHYFVGDAVAKSGNVELAHTYFSKAVEIDAANFLAWNGRGVTSALRGDYDQSLADFNKALSINSEFVDATNNLGMMRISQGQGRKGAIRRFTSVIDASPDFALAYHGLGCLELLSAQTLAPQENVNIQKALELAPDAQELYVQNMDIFATAFFDKQRNAMLASSGEEGAFIDRTFTDRSPQHKEARISGALTQVNQAQAFYDQNRGNIFLRRGAERNLNIAKMRLAEISGPDHTSRDDWTKIASSNPQLATNVRKVTSSEATRYSGISSQAQSGAQAMAAQSRAMDIASFGVSAEGARQAFSSAPKNPGLAVAAVNFKALGGSAKFNQKGYENTAQSANNVSNYFKRSTANIPIITSRAPAPLPSSSPGNYKAPEIPTPTNYKGTVNRPNHGGATTNRSQVTWDDGQWPFLPIFGLLYFATEEPIVANEG